MLRFTKLFLLSSLLLFGAGCDQYEFNELTPTLAVPLLNTRFEVKDLLARVDSSNISSNANGEITLIYKSKLVEINSADIIQLSDQSYNINQAYTGPTINPFPAGQEISINNNQVLNFSGAAGIELYKIAYQSGNFSITVNSAIQHDLKLKLNLPRFTKAGVPFTLNIDMPFTGSSQRTSQNISIAGYEMDLTAGGGFNSLEANFEIGIVSRGGAPLNNGENIAIGIGINTQNYEQVDAYLGQQNINIAEDSILIRLFQFSTESPDNENFFALTDPKFNLTVNNSFVLPLQFNFDKLQLRNTNSGTQNDVLFTNFENPFSINAPLVPTQTATTSKNINRDNSNIRDLITPTEKLLTYKIGATINPGEKTINKINRNSKLNVDALLELPLTGYSSGWALLDTTDISFESIKIGGDNELKRTNFRINILNGFPINIDLQVYFLDSNNVKIDSLFTSSQQQLILSGEIGSNGRIVQARNNRIDIAKEKTASDRIFKAKKVVVMAKLQTKNGQNKQEVKVYNDAFFDVSLGFSAEVGFKF